MKLETREDLLRRAERQACGCEEDGTQDWCFLCNRATCHWGEHSDEQLLRFIGRCPEHSAFTPDNCPSCGTARVIGGAR